MTFQDDIPNLLLESVEDIFSTNLSLSPEVEDGDVISEEDRNLKCFMALKGKISGELKLVLSEFSACTIASAMLGMEVEQDSVDIKDAVGEVINMLAGGIKNKLGSSEYTFDIGVPLWDEPLSKEDVSQLTTVTKNFTCDGVKFQVSLIYKIQEEQQKTEEAPVKKLSAAEMLMQAMAAGGAPATAPAAETSEEEASKTDTSPEQKETRSISKDRKILIIHSDKFERNEIDRVFQEEQYKNIDFAEGGREGIEKTKANQPEIVVLDSFLNDMNGPEVCQEIKKINDGNTKVIILTSNGSSLIKDLAKNSGADDLCVTTPDYKNLFSSLDNLS